MFSFCVSHEVGEMQTRAFRGFFVAVISGASFNKQNTSLQNVRTSTAFSPFFFPLNTDESKLPHVIDIIIIVVAVVVMRHCHRDFCVVAFLRTLAAFARLDDHVGKLFDLGCVTNVVEDGQWLQVLRHTARGSRGFRIYGIVQTEDLRDTTQGHTHKQVISFICV